MEQTLFSECKNPISSDVLLVSNLNCDETRLYSLSFDISIGVTYIFQSGCGLWAKTLRGAQKERVPILILPQ